MRIDETQRVPAPQAKVWAALNDPQVLKQCLPGCESLEMTSPTDMVATVVVRGRAGQGAVFRQGDSLGPRPAERLPHLRRRFGRPRRVRQGRRHGLAFARRAGRDAAALCRRRSDRRQARPARRTPDRRDREEARRRVLPGLRRSGRPRRGADRGARAGAGRRARSPACHADVRRLVRAVRRRFAAAPQAGTRGAILLEQDRF